MTAAPSAAAEKFRSELRRRLTRMRVLAGQNGRKSLYIESLEQSAAAIFRAIERSEPAGGMAAAGEQ